VHRPPQNELGYREILKTANRGASPRLGKNMDKEILAKRMEQLETSNRRMKLFAMASLAVLALGAAQSQSKIPDVVQAKQFQVVGSGGKILIDIGTFGDKDHPAVLIFDRKGIVRESLGIDAFSDDSGVFSFDHNGTLRTASLAVESGTFKGNSGVFVYDNNGTLRTDVNFNVVANFTGFEASDSNGKPRVVAGISPLTGNAEFVNLLDGNGTTRATMNADADSSGATGLELFDKSAVFRAGMSIDSQQAGGFGNEALFFANPQSKFVGDFFSPIGQGGTYTTFDANG
jgi:hypothetical protein